MGLIRLSTTLMVVLVVFCGLVAGAVIDLEEKNILSDESVRYRMVMDNKNSSHGSTEPYISVNVTFESYWAEEEKNPKDISVWILAYHWGYEGSIGVIDSEGSPKYCCFEADVESLGCRPGEPLVLEGAKEVTKPPMGNHVLIAPGMTEKNFEKKFSIGNAGPYYVQFINCDESHDVILKGDVTFRNPYGYLSGDVWYYLPFFGFLALLYIGLACYWAYVSIRYRKILLMVQNCIAVVIILGLVESVTWFLELQWANESGSRNWGAIEIAIASSVLKRAVSRLLVLVVSMGYGVVKYDLGRSTTMKVVLIGIAYFGCSIVQSSVEIRAKEGETNDFATFFATMITFPLALIDTIFYWWIFLSLMKTIQQLSIRQASVKLLLYQRFFYVLVCAAVITTIVVIFQLIQAVTSYSDAHWQTEWIYDAIWHLLYYAILVSIAVLWRPTENNTRYAYTESEDAEIMLEEVTSGTEMVIEGVTQRTKGTTVDPKDLDELTLPSFSIDDDDDFLDEPTKME